MVGGLSKNLPYRTYRNLVVYVHAIYLKESAKTPFLERLKFRKYLLIKFFTSYLFL